MYSSGPHYHCQFQGAHFRSKGHLRLQFVTLLGSIRHVLVSYSLYCRLIYILTSSMAVPYHHITFRGSLDIPGLGSPVIPIICSDCATVSCPATLDQSLTRSRKAVITYPALRQQSQHHHYHPVYKPRPHLNLIFYLYTPPVRLQGLTCQQLA